MSSAVTKQQYSYSNEVKFSDLRRDFAESSSGAIPFSGYYRTTSLSNTNPVVPDATENTHVPTSSTISMSAFKNNTTVKRYYVTQSGTDSQLAIHGLSWNGNLDKNIIIAAHGNSLRSLIKHLDNISDEDIVKLEIPTGAPIHYLFDKDGCVISKKNLIE